METVSIFMFANISTNSVFNGNSQYIYVRKYIDVFLCVSVGNTQYIYVRKYIDKFCFQWKQSVYLCSQIYRRIHASQKIFRIFTNINVLIL